MLGSQIKMLSGQCENKHLADTERYSLCKFIFNQEESVTSVNCLDMSAYAVKTESKSLRG